MTERRDKIIEALVGVDLTCARFTWSSPHDGDPFYGVWVTMSNSSPSGWKVWSASTHAEALLVRAEMQDLSDAARRLAL